MSDKFNNSLKCICNNLVIFEKIDDVGCDWGIHSIIQCPKCEELFSIDKKCPAFQSLELLFEINADIFSKNEQSIYLENSHPL